MHESEDLRFKDSVVAPIYFYTQPYMQSPKVKGMFYSPLSYFFFDYCTLEK